MPGAPPLTASAAASHPGSRSGLPLLATGGSLLAAAFLGSLRHKMRRRRRGDHYQVPARRPIP